MAIEVRQLAHVCIFARDLAETRDFYRDVLGVPIAFNFTREDEWIGFYLDLGGRTNIEVFRKPEAESNPPNRIDHLCLEVSDIDAAVAHVRAQGGACTDKKYGVDDTWQAWVTDPNGVRIELFQYTPRSAQFVGGDRAADW